MAIIQRMNKSLMIFLTFSILVSCLSTPVFGQDPLDYWSVRNPKLPLVSYRALAYGNSTMVAIGWGGTIITSPDGENWSVQRSGTMEQLTDVTFGNSMFVVTGENCTILTSPDGVNWTRRNSSSNESLKSVFYGNSIFVAAGENGALLTSPDGINWTPRNSGTSEHLTGITAGNSTLLVTGENGTLLMSGDGTTWIARNTGISDDLRAVTYGSSGFVLLVSHSYNSGSTYTSLDGVTWTNRRGFGGREFYNIAFCNGRYFIMGNGGIIYSSPNGLSWSWETEGGMPPLNDMLYAEGSYIVAADWGRIYFKPDGGSWTAAPSGLQDSLGGVVYGNSMFVAVGSSGEIIGSPDGTEWTSRVSPGWTMYNDVTFGNSTFVAVGREGEVAYSNDGINWSSTISGIAELTSVTYADSTFVAVGYRGTIVTSGDGINWAHHDLETNIGLLGIVYATGKFVVVGKDGIILTSIDGKTWKRQYHASGRHFYGITYGNSTFLLVGGRDVVYTSPDGHTWTEVNVPSDDFLIFAGYGNSTFLIGGINGDLLTSYDGKIWSRKNSGTTNGLTGAAFGDNRLVVCGHAGTILQSERFVTVSGKVSREGTPVEDVAINFSHDNRTVKTDAEGNYYYRIPYGAPTMATPGKEGYTFNPTHYSYTNLTGNRENQDFTAVYSPEDTVVITNPADGETVSGMVDIVAEQQLQGVTIQKVIFYVDGQKISEDTAAPFQCRWNTITVGDGICAVSIEAVDTDDKLYADSITVRVNNLVFPPIVGVNRYQLNFCAVTGGNRTGPQTFMVINQGGGTISWEVLNTTPWLNFNPKSGFGEQLVTVTVKPEGLKAGTYNAALVVRNLDSSRVPPVVKVQLTVKNASQDKAPFGAFDRPVEGATVMSSIPVTGWVLDDIEVEGVKIYRDPVAGEPAGRVFIGDAVLVDGARPDVEKSYPEYPGNYRAGWGYMLLTNGLPGKGNGMYRLIVAAADCTGNETLLGSRTIYCDNANAIKPFGAIDKPIQGGTVSGDDFINWGWALTPQPNTIRKNGSNINLWIDGKKMSNMAIYNLYRGDIAGFFPDYNNSMGASGYFTIDTTQFRNGVHTISWSVTDDAGNSDGIGSRFFTAYNTYNRWQTASDNGALGKKPMWRPVYPDPQDCIDSFEPVRVLTGFGTYDRGFPVFPDNDGMITVRIPQNGRLEIHPDVMPRKTDPGHLSKNNKKISSPASYGMFYRKSTDSRCTAVLPAGSTFDGVTGIFYWAPGPGFLGAYDFELVRYETGGNAERKRLRVVIEAE